MGSLVLRVHDVVIHERSLSPSLQVDHRSGDLICNSLLAFQVRSHGIDEPISVAMGRTKLRPAARQADAVIVYDSAMKSEEVVATKRRELLLLQRSDG